MARGGNAHPRLAAGARAGALGVFKFEMLPLEAEDMAGRAARAVLSAHGGLLSVDAQVRDGALRVGRFPERALSDPPNG